ncbi:hypothetical protein [Klebsiella aerogenes]|uniref:hypothetical protein n=1 Tax=Klebsiella aerogenes TaxID=548 RepID=UPI00275DDCE8|nr:ATP-binding protein [Klebsiella aerogenes]HDS6533866.1 ATP-binding protein [Klebsiella aerogenes]HDS9641919.1 ATP-binding protein [Klebsiella aerogenes]HDT1124601.1 ATP-binding protein [Klebsiella aerogenes]HDU4094016.1 ATP-binding protein [Klebsiella aerogenes]
MFYYQIKNQNGDILFNSIPAELQLYFLESQVENASFKTNDNKYRAAVYCFENSEIKIVSSDQNHLKSSKLIKREAEIISTSVDRINNAYEHAKAESYAHARRLIHNLTTLNAQNSQHVYLVIPQGVFASKSDMDANSWIDAMTQEVEKDTKRAALSLMRIAKNSMQFKSEINVYNSLINNDFRLRIRKHSIHKVLMNSFYVFFPDFTDSSVKVVVDKTNEDVLIDYESFQVATYYLIENAAKYILPKTELRVSYKKIKHNDQLDVKFSMTSLEIKDNEVDSIFIEGFSGEASKKLDKNGNGIGMPRTRKLLALSNATINVVPCVDGKKITEYERVYQRNDFIITLQCN